MKEFERAEPEGEDMSEGGMFGAEEMLEGLCSFE